jgi:tungstate transport system substrate-binding protein
VLLVTTHSVEDSGLLGDVTDAFHAAHPGYRIVAMAVGSGAALEIGRRGDADVLLTHDPDGERHFMESGFGTEQAPVMVNQFLLVGPASDPAGARQARDAISGFQAVARSGARFLSRGDDSGTHRKERALWRAAGLEPWTSRPAWYVEAGLGMAETLQTADQMDAYLLADEGTVLSLGHRLRLVPLVASDPALANPYSLTIPRRQRNPEGGRVFAAWLLGPGQDVIGRYGVDRFGRPLFWPMAGTRSDHLGTATDAPAQTVGH